MSENKQGFPPHMAVILIVAIVAIVGVFLWKANAPAPRPAESQIIYGPGTPGGPTASGPAMSKKR